MSHSQQPTAFSERKYLSSQDKKGYMICFYLSKRVGGARNE